MTQRLVQCQKKLLSFRPLGKTNAPDIRIMKPLASLRVSVEGENVVLKAVRGVIDHRTYHLSMPPPTKRQRRAQLQKDDL